MLWKSNKRNFCSGPPLLTEFWECCSKTSFQSISGMRAFGAGSGQNQEHDFGCFPQLCFYSTFENAAKTLCCHANKKSARNCVLVDNFSPATIRNSPSRSFCFVGYLTRARDNNYTSKEDLRAHLPRERTSCRSWA